MRETIRQFAEAMENVLAANDHKGGWDAERMGIYDLERGLAEEVAEYYIDRTSKELIDIANFCMMLWSRKERGPQSALCQG